MYTELLILISSGLYIEGKIKFHDFYRDKSLLFQKKIQLSF